jgi:3-hydroxymyristoyl/3-hydroxydecanoyl-(acyl carrier protein) dehydratase
VGQLAAWSAMAALDFRVRPLAGIAGAVLLSSEVEPGDALELDVEIQRCDESAVAYGGSARREDTTVLELDGCVGPMFPLDDYDSPDRLRERFETLCGDGERADRFEPLDPGEREIIEHQPGRRLAAELHIPATAAFFADHFPRRPVFPATLLLDHLLELALTLAADREPGDPVRVSSVVNAKMRTFVLPGQLVRLEAEVRSPEKPQEIALSAAAEGTRVCTARAAVAAVSA